MYQLHYQATKPITTAHLAQTMTLLSLTIEELRQKIDSELSSNPALEIIEDKRCPICHRIIPLNGKCPICSFRGEADNDEPLVFVSPRDDFIAKGDYNYEDYSEEDISPAGEDLSTYVFKQIAPEIASDDLQIAAFLLTHLNDDGFITTPLDDVANYFHISLSRVEEIHTIIKHADPVGVGSRSTQEALLVQLEILSESKVIPTHTYQIVQDCMELLTHRDYSRIAKKYHISQRDVADVARFIGDNLNPFPARSHWGDVRQSSNSQISVYRNPDIIISHLNGNTDNPLIVEIILPLRGSLRINPLFKQAVREAEIENKDDWKNDLERASLFVKCMQQRFHTMERLMQKIVSKQKAFIIHGEKYLKPITRVVLSKELEVHESTISRAVANKTVQLPNRRIIPLSQFFDRSLNVRMIIRDIISEEVNPLSDSELSEILSKQGINVARRTVAKYRSMEGILPAHLRQGTAQMP